MNNHETVTNQKVVASEVLKILFSIDPDAVVAGDAPTDWHMGKPARCIDVFVYTAISNKWFGEYLYNVGIKECTYRYDDGNGYRMLEGVRIECEFVLRGEKVRLQLLKSPRYYKGRNITI